MRGNQKHYRDTAMEGDKHLRKLLKARNKYMGILDDLEREIENCRKNIQKNMHCVGLLGAETQLSFIPE